MGVIRALESVGVRFEIEGMENMASIDGPCVFIGNHMSTLETFCLPAMILPYKSLTFVVKKSLTEYPVFRHIMRATQAIPVTRENPRDDLRAVLEGGEKRLRDGMSIVIFPQTTRSLEFRPEEFNSLGVKLARRAGVPVVPIALKTDAWGVGKLFLKDFGKIDPARAVHFSFGEPMAVSGRGDEEHESVVRFIGAKMREWKG
jgi:1-acyl-sn-glycerol-3-phosphate acyltransferase